MGPTITITTKEYEGLLEDRAMLICLQNAGVDNWQGYDYAMELLRECED
jgi:hypothetical protein